MKLPPPSSLGPPSQSKSHLCQLPQLPGSAAARPRRGPSVSGPWLPSVRGWVRHPGVPFNSSTLSTRLWAYYASGSGLAKLFSGLQGPARGGRPRVGRGRELARGSGTNRVQASTCCHQEHQDANRRPARSWAWPAGRLHRCSQMPQVQVFFSPRPIPAHISPLGQGHHHPACLLRPHMPASSSTPPLPTRR